MSGTSKKKLCWNCETRVTLQQENCSFCGVYLSPSSDFENDYNILTPPYRNQNDDDKSDSFESPYNPQDDNKEESSEFLNEMNDQVSVKLMMFTMIFLFLGSTFLLFSALMLIFSQNGVLTLSLSADYWYIYLGFAVPLLFLGWKGLTAIPEGS
jgi:hypothetical protein